MLYICDRAAPDPVAEILVPDAYVRWTLLATEEACGEEAVAAALRQAELSHLQERFPEETLTTDAGLTAGAYADYLTHLMTGCHEDAQETFLHIGHLATQHGIEQQGVLANLAATMALQLFTPTRQLRLGMQNMLNVFARMWHNSGQPYRVYLEKQAPTLTCVMETCPFCAGKEAREPMCWMWDGVLQEFARWIMGEEYAVEEVACRATGAPACKWEISQVTQVA